MSDYACNVRGCLGQVKTLHRLPQEPNCQREWLKFIYDDVPQSFNPRLVVCSAHFTPDCFSNLGQYQAGFAQRLKLKPGSLPTILTPQPQPTSVSITLGLRVFCVSLMYANVSAISYSSYL